MAVPAVWSTKLYDAALATTGSFQTLYTVPSGHRLIFRSAIVRNASGSVSTLNLGVGGPRTLHTFNALAVAGEAEWDTWFVLNDGDTIVAFIDHQPWNILLSGQLLTTP
jgi:hypothetical protein